MTQTVPAAKPHKRLRRALRRAWSAGSLAMGVSPIFVRLADVGPFASAFWRVALALPALYAWMRLDRCAEAARRRVGSRSADDPRRPRLRRRSLLLASVDRHHQRRQRDLLRHHRADLGGAVRLADSRRARRTADARRPRLLRPGRRRAAGAEPASAAGRRDRRSLRPGDRRLLRPLFPRREGGARARDRRRASRSRRRSSPPRCCWSSRSASKARSCRTA